MIRPIIVFTWLGASISPWMLGQERTSHPSYDYEAARPHEIGPHRRTIPLDGVHPGFNQLHLKLIVSPAGDVLSADAGGDDKTLKFWPKLKYEVERWKFMPFEKDGTAVTAEVEEYIDLVPPERLPKIHAAAPVIRPDSKVTITLQRSGCYGTCPSYTVKVSTDGIVFDGHGFVVASGKHTDTADADQVRKLAQNFVAADFYSMNATYRASVTDNPSYLLSIAIDGRTKEVEDYVGSWEGMPAVITELEDEVDRFAHTARWIEGSDGLVEALKAENFNFKSFEAQVMVKESVSEGKVVTVKEFLEAGVPLQPQPAPKPKEEYMAIPFEGVGWLTAASSQPEVLQVLMDAGASKDDPSDKNLALAGAARSGKLDAARALIAYGANPNADFSKQIITETSGGMAMGEEGAGSVLIYAAESGNPDMVREILKYHPDVEARNREGKTAVFFAGESHNRDVDGARVECVRLLAKHGANVNARDYEGNTPLHEIYLTDVEEELLKHGADVNARNNDGETPIFTNVDNDAISLFIKHGADLTIRNNKGETVIEAAKSQGPLRQEVLRNAIQKLNQH